MIFLNFLQILKEYAQIIIPTSFQLVRLYRLYGNKATSVSIDHKSENWMNTGDVNVFTRRVNYDQGASERACLTLKRASRLFIKHVR